MNITNTNKSVILSQLNNWDNLMGFIRSITDCERNKTLVSLGLIKPYYTMSKARSLYGNAWLKMIIDEGMINPIKDGKNTSAWRLPRVRLEELAMESKYITWSGCKNENDEFINNIEKN
jgi:hypothetical protein